MSKWLYREHRGGLKESMRTLKKFDSLYEMITYISGNVNSRANEVSIYLYDVIPDVRIGWKRTYLVCIGKDAWGFCTECDDS